MVEGELGRATARMEERVRGPVEDGLRLPDALARQLVENVAKVPRARARALPSF